MRVRESIRQAGFTVVELLVTAAIVGVVLATLTTIFVTQTRVSERTQDRNEVDGKVRAIAEVLMQDLQQAGSVATFDGVLPPEYRDAALGPDCTRSDRSGCVVVDTVSGDVNIYYMTSLVRPTNGSWARGGNSACRRIDYQLQGDELFRRDVTCGDTTTEYADFSLATGIDSIDITFICHNPESPEPNISACYSATTYPREATVAIVGRADSARNTSQVSVELSTPLPNLRPPVDYQQVPVPVNP